MIYLRYKDQEKKQSYKGWSRHGFYVLFYETRHIVLLVEIYNLFSILDAVFEYEFVT